MKRFVLFLAFLLLSTATPWAQFTRPRIQGIVQLPRGVTEAPDIVRVHLTTQSGGYVASKTLSSETNFMFDNLDRGQYIVTVEALGFQPGSARADLVSPYSGTEAFVRVQLGPRIPERGAVAGAKPPTVGIATLQVPKKAQRELDKAREASADKKPGEAIKHLNKALEIEPNIYQAYNNLAVEYMRLGDQASATSALEKSVSINPQDATSHRNLGELRMASGDYAAAAGDLEKAVELDQGNGKGWRLLGNVRLALEQHGPALEAFEKASSIDPALRDHLGIGQCHLATNNIEQALDEFRAFVAENPDDARTAGVKAFIAQVEKDLNQ